jgi:hypothetical protein
MKKIALSLIALATISMASGDIDPVTPTVEATEVAMKAIEQGVARRKLSRQEIYEMALETIKSAREQTQTLMREGLIKMP